MLALHVAFLPHSYPAALPTEGQGTSQPVGAT
jgi:hypothetical protein